MVDGADKINKLSNNVYINKQDALQEIKPTDAAPIPLVEKKDEYKFPFTIEKADPDEIEFEIPKNASRKANEFIAALIKNKKSLMKELNIDSDTYNMLAQTAVGIAGKETKFGGTADRIYKAYRELYVRYEKFMKTTTTRKIDYSRGMTNLKYTMHINDQTQSGIQLNMLKFGIYDEYQLENPANSAIGTIILLDNLNKRIDRNYSEGFEQSKEKYGTTRIDALCALWNGAHSKELVKGNFDASKWDYTKEVHKTIDEYKLITK